MRIIILDCANPVGPPLIRWLLGHGDASVVGADERADRMLGLLEQSRFSYYAVGVREDAAALARFLHGADVVIDLGELMRSGGARRRSAASDSHAVERQSRAAGALLIRVPYVVHPDSQPGAFWSPAESTDSERDRSSPRIAVASPSAAVEITSEQIIPVDNTDDLGRQRVRVGTEESQTLKRWAMTASAAFVVRLASHPGAGESAADRDAGDHSEPRTDGLAALIGLFALGRAGAHLSDVVSIAPLVHPESGTDLPGEFALRYERPVEDGVGALTEPMQPDPPVVRHRGSWLLPPPDTDYRPAPNWQSRRVMADLLEAMLGRTGERLD